MNTRAGRPQLTEYEQAHCEPGAQHGLLLLRALGDADLLDIAYDADRSPGSAFHEVLALMGPKTNHYWIIAGAADEAYARGLIDEREYDCITL